MSAEAAQTIRDWIRHLHSADFAQIAIKSPEARQEVGEKVIDVNNNQITEENEDEGKIVWGDGTRYLGPVTNHQPEGRGQLQLPDGRLLQGVFVGGQLEGEVREVSAQDCSVTELLYERGSAHGTFRHTRLDGQLLGYGRFSNGVKVGRQLVVGSGGNSYYIGCVDSRDKLCGEVVFLYPCLQTVIVGQYKGGKLTSGHYRTLSRSSLTNDGFISLEFECGLGREVLYDPPSCFSISRRPLETDQYEERTVRVAASTVAGAGEGLFAIRDLSAGDLVCLFSGSKIYKDNNKTSLKYGDQEWSDFRLTLDKSVDLDIGPEYQSCQQYRATLGHKACHHFQLRNSAFEEFEHPRFGRIMSIVAVRDIQEGEEIFVSYNYSLPLSPPWYQELWFSHCRDRGLSRQKILELAKKEEVRWGVSMEIPDFITNM